MKKGMLLGILMVSFSLSFSQTVTEKLNEYLDAAQKADLFNGSVLVAQKGKTLLEKGYGFKNVETKSAASNTTIYQIGSVTKQFTATIILKLAEQRKLKLTDKLSNYFPTYPLGEKITIEHLLTHTSGIWNYTNDEMWMEKGVEKPLDEQGMLSLFKNRPLDFEPGTQYSYSNSGYILLGYIIEKTTDKKYEKVVREQIFEPLRMFNSGFDFTRLNNPDKAVGYEMISKDRSTKPLSVDSTVSFSAGAMYSTLSDLYKWNQSLTTEKVLRKTSLQNAFTPRLEKYGFGWVIDTINGRRIINHDGGIHGFLAHNSIFPKDSIFITILSNSNSSKLVQVEKDVQAILFNQPYKLPKVYNDRIGDTVILNEYVGEYELAPAFKIVVSQHDGKMKVQATGQPQFDLFSKTDSVFFIKVVDAEIEFLKDDKGNVDRLILVQGGARQTAIKKVR